MKNKLIALILMTAFCSMPLISSSATPPPPIVYITQNGAGTMDGSSWLNALPGSLLQMAIDNVPYGFRIWVGAGTYLPLTDAYGNSNPSDPKTIGFHMKNGVEIYGGFAGFETSENQRTSFGLGQVNESILSGDIGIAGNPGDNCYHVIDNLNNMLDNSAVIDGFTISDGYADNDADFFTASGGGMLNYFSSPIIRNCIFYDNYALVGGGLFNIYYSSPEVSNSVFNANVAMDDVGGGAVNYVECSPVYDHCNFTGNEATGYDGLGGGMFNYESGVLITYCSFTGNICSEAGGGMFSEYADIDVINSTFSGNYGYVGAGLLNYSISFDAVNSSFTGNTADDDGAGMYNEEAGISLVNCLIAGNTSYCHGGGMFSEDAFISLTNCTLAGNNAYETGGMFSDYNAYVDVYNSIIWGNSANYTNEITAQEDMYLYNSCFSNIAGYDIDGNFIPANCINVYPQYVNAAGGDYRLCGSSPCINLGNNGYNAQLNDIRSQLRVQNVTIDMGAYEWTSGVDPQTCCTNPLSGGNIDGEPMICAFDIPQPIFSYVPALDYCGGTLEYKWQSSTTSPTQGFTDIPSSNSETYAPGPLEETTWFKRLARVSCKTDWTGAAESNVLQIYVNILPDPFASSNEPICAGNTLGLSSIFGYTSYYWTGPNGFTSPDQNPFIPNAQAVNSGLYTVTVTDFNGCSNTGSTFARVGDFDANAYLLYESAGTVDGVSTIADYEMYNNFDNDDLFMSGTGSVNSTTPSCCYSDVSGRANILLSNAGGKSFQIANINSTGVNNIYLSFGVNKNSTTSNGSELKVEVSTNGTSYTSIPVPPLPTGAGTTEWYRLTCTSGIPATSNLRIRWTNTSSGGTGPNFRIDDVILAGNIPASAIAPASTVYVCTGNTTTLTCNGGINYNWSTGQTTQSITVNAGGTYDVTYTAVTGCIAYASATVTIVPPPVAEAGPNQAVCAKTSVTLTATGGVSYAWNNGVTQGVPFTPSASKNYTVTVTDAYGCTATDAATVTVLPQPVITASVYPTIVCQGNPATLSAGGAVTYAWSNGSAGTPVVVTPGLTTTFTVTGTNANGCTNTASVTLTVKPKPAMIMTATTNPICKGKSTTITVTGAATYNWSGGLGAGNIKTVTPALTTNYTVTGTNSNGCTASVSITINVNATPVVTVTANPTLVCAGSQSVLTAGGATTYNWSNGVNGSPINVFPMTTTIYTVTGTNAAGCTATNKVTISVNALPSVTATANPSTIYAGSSSTLTAYGASNYAWSNGLGSGNPKSVVPAVTTTYTVTGTNIYNCKNTATVTVTVIPKSEEGDAGQVDEISMDIVQPLFECYPNPFNEKTTIRFMLPADDHARLDVYDITGKKIMTLFDSKVNGKTEYRVEFDGRTLAGGLYLYRISSTGEVFSGRMLMIK